MIIYFKQFILYLNNLPASSVLPVLIISSTADYNTIDLIKLKTSRKLHSADASPIRSNDFTDNAKACSTIEASVQEPQNIFVTNILPAL